MHYRKYCEKLDMAIEELVLEEAKNPGGLSFKKQEMLHVLLENKKHIKHYKVEMAEREEPVSASIVKA